MFGEVVGEIGGAGLPMDMELVLADAVADPVKAHVNGFGSTLFDGVVEDASGARVVNLDRRGGLWPAEFSERGADGTSILGVVETCADFCFGG